MPAATYTETSVADNVTVTCSRFRANPTTMDWRVQLQCQVVSDNGEVVRTVDVDVSTLFGVGAMNTFKGNLNTALATLATNRSISPTL